MFQGADVTAALAAGGTLLAVMIALSWYGAVTLPASARVPVHWGFGWGSYVPKWAGLIIWPVAGTVVYVLLGVGSHGLKGDLAPTVLMIVIIGGLAAFQAGALTAAGRTVGDGAMGPEPQ